MVKAGGRGGGVEGKAREEKCVVVWCTLCFNGTASTHRSSKTTTDTSHCPGRREPQWPWPQGPGLLHKNLAKVSAIVEKMLSLPLYIL